MGSMLAVNGARDLLFNMMIYRMSLWVLNIFLQKSYGEGKDQGYDPNGFFMFWHQIDPSPSPATGKDLCYETVTLILTLDIQSLKKLSFRK